MREGVGGVMVLRGAVRHVSVIVTGEWSLGTGCWVSGIGYRVLAMRDEKHWIEGEPDMRVNNSGIRGNKTHRMEETQWAQQLSLFHAPNDLSTMPLYGPTYPKLTKLSVNECLCLHAEENALLEAGRDRIGDDGVIYCNT